MRCSASSGKACPSSGTSTSSHHFSSFNLFTTTTRRHPHCDQHHDRHLHRLCSLRFRTCDFFLSSLPDLASTHLFSMGHFPPMKPSRNLGSRVWFLNARKSLGYGRCEVRVWLCGLHRLCCPDLPARLTERQRSPLLQAQRGIQMLLKE